MTPLRQIGNGKASVKGHNVAVFQYAGRPVSGQSNVTYHLSICLESTGCTLIPISATDDADANAKAARIVDRLGVADDAYVEMKRVRGLPIPSADRPYRVRPATVFDAPQRATAGVSA